jgi:hypothetical protein
MTQARSGAFDQAAGRTAADKATEKHSWPF